MLKYNFHYQKVLDNNTDSVFSYENSLNAIIKSFLLGNYELAFTCMLELLLFLLKDIFCYSLKVSRECIRAFAPIIIFYIFVKLMLPHLKTLLPLG